MKIKKLTLHGFKSFPDRTEVEFHEGITAIVGPNGCGKSNISDAIRWVLGEQRPTAIRGSRMEEAIFEGTVNRKPIHRAEVELVLSNEEGRLPVPYQEVSFGRTVFRGGESEYRLNGEVCRLKDIEDLCRDTGLGANAYSVIENRMIDSILSDRAEERRVLFEEAAEISRYKDRRRTALRRLEQAEEDLERLEDLLGEVRTKVRSLAQQRGRAERHEEYRSRRLQLEVALARARLADVEERLEETEGRLEELKEDQPSDRAELSRRETEAETLRVEIAEAESRRSELASRLERVRSRLESAERERLVAQERAAAARDRLAGLREELRELDARQEEVEAERDRLSERISEQEGRLQDLQEERNELERDVESRREIRERRKAQEEETVDSLRGVRSRLEALRSRCEAAEERVEERRAELARREEELREAERTAEEQAARRGEVDEELERARDRHEEAGAELEEAAALADRRRRAVEATRRELSGLEGDLSAERERVEGLAALVGSGEEHPPAVAALLEDLGPGDGVLGVLAGSIRAPTEVARAVETQLGAYLHAVVVRDWDVVEDVRSWLRDRDEEGGGLVVLPREPGPRADRAADRDGRLLERVELTEPGREWARALLSGVGYREDGSRGPASSPWVAADGSGQDRWGAVRLGAPGAGRGVLRRRAELERARSEVERKKEERSELQSRLESRKEELAAAEDRRRELQDELSELEGRVRELESRAEAAEHRHELARRERQELSRRIEELEGSVEEARREREHAEQKLEGLEEERQELEEEASRRRTELLRAESELEKAGDALQELELRIARERAELRSLSERWERASEDLEELADRRETLQEERDEKRRSIREAGRAEEEKEESVAELLRRRASLEAEVREQDGRLAAKRRELEKREAWLKDARQAERELSDKRHELELEVAELRGKRSNVRERLEAEWDRSFEELVEEADPPEEGGPAEWSEELEDVRRRLNRLGPVNLLAAQEYEEEKERLEFLEGQKEDLLEAREDLEDSIRRINRAAARAFRETFDEIRENFQRTFATLFEGGECDVWLDAPDDPLDSPIEISASPRGKRTQRIHLLSGGERALTALALLFGIYLAKPSPFCIMDEVDAPLDESNVDRFTAMLDRFKGDTQFVVITHNPRTIASADWVYGVTMQEPGVSSVVGVDFDDLPAGDAA